MPHRKGAGPSAIKFWRFSSISAYTFWRKMTRFDLVAHMGKGLVFRRSVMPPSRGGAAALPILEVLHLCLHPLTKNDHVRQGNTCREGGLFLGISHAFHSKGRSPSDPQFWVPFYLCLHLGRRTTNFVVVTHMMRFWGVSHASTYIAQMRRAVCQQQLSFLS